jgi:hypothetical protein
MLLRRSLLSSSKVMAVVVLGALLSSSSGIVACNVRHTSLLPAPTPSPVTDTGQSGSGEIKVLAEGAHSNIQDSFVAVVRDAETYAALRKLEGLLPDLKVDFFETDAVVAAFLGERRTGGFGVEISRSGNTLNVGEKKPAKDTMVTEMITAPFKMVSVPGGARSPLSLAVDETWRQRLLPFSVDSGQFKMSGGIAGITREFKLAGELRLMVEGASLLTVVFAVQGSDSAKKRALDDSATGMITNDGQVKINKMSASLLIDSPHSGLKATGQLSNSDRKVVLNLVSMSMIPDGFGGIGNLTATMSGAAPGPR